MSFTLSPQMSLIIPTAGTENGPQYALDINASLAIIDGHNHTAGYGAPIPATAININGDLSFLSHNATLLRAVRFSPQSSPISALAPDLAEIFVSGNELWYNGTNGSQVQITNGNSINATSSGISSGTATAAFSGSTLQVLANTNLGANIFLASLILSNNTVGSNTLTLQPPVIASSYSITLPQKPLTQSCVFMDASGVMSTSPFLILSNNTVGSNTLTLQPPVIASSYSITLPQKPLTQGYVFMDASGVMSTSPFGYTPKITRYLSGSGTHTVTGSPLYMKVTLVGGGSGGGGGDTGGPTGGGAQTSFGGTLLVALGGPGVSATGNGGSGGGTNFTAGATILVSAAGGAGGAGGSGEASGGYVIGGNGGSSPFGGAGGGGSGAGGTSAGVNTGSGGGGAGASGGNSGGPGGSAGGYLQAIIPSPAPTYAYSVGGGSGGGGGTGAGNGGSGIIIVEEYYQ